MLMYALVQMVLGLLGTLFQGLALGMGFALGKHLLERK